MVSHRIYGWHESKNHGITKPRNGSFNIKGIELEISDDGVGYITDNLIDENILTVPCNEHINKKHTIVVESDGSVDHELIIKACGNNKLMEAVKILEENYHNECCNRHGTSCHIHLNRAHLRSRGITETAIFKAVEFLYPILFRVSGRSFRSLDWCKSYLLHQKYNRYEEEQLDLLELSKRVDEIDDEIVEYNDSRYSVTNTTNRNTIELRIFSNYYNFNSKYIKLYIDLCDFIMDIAELMGENISYFEEYETLITMINQFFNRRSRKELFQKHNIDIFLMPADERKRKIFEDIKNLLEEKIENHFQRDFSNNLTELMALIRIFRDINEKFEINNLDFEYKLNMSQEEINQIANKIFEQIDEKIENL